MKVVQRYLARTILSAVAYVLAAFMVLFAFFDFIDQLSDLGKNNLGLEQAIQFVVLNLPAYAYDLLPIAALIGTIYALAQLAAHSEFTIMRIAGLSTWKAVRMVMLPGLLLVAATYLLGEFVMPRAELQAQKLRLEMNAGSQKVSQLRSGLWAKDTARSESGQKITRFVNVNEVLPDGSLRGVRIYEFDAMLRLSAIHFAEQGIHQPGTGWQLRDVTETAFSNPDGRDELVSTRVTRIAERTWHSELNPEILGAQLILPDRMTAQKLDAYIQHLEQNRQTTERYQIAFWKKLIYPFAVLVMMALALPFAYLHFRAGSISFKVFAGIMIGIGFYLLNNLFAHLGLLHTWPPFLTVALPSIAVLAVALAALRWVDRH